jgi:hypothetical protein
MKMKGEKSREEEGEGESSRREEKKIRLSRNKTNPLSK